MAKATYPTIGIAASVMFGIAYFIGCLLNSLTPYSVQVAFWAIKKTLVVMGTIANAKVTHNYKCYTGDFFRMLTQIPNYSKATETQILGKEKFIYQFINITQ